MKAGDLRHLIILYAPTEGTPDSMGHPTITWAVHSRVYAAIRDVSGREFFEAHSYQMEDVVTFTVRYDADITTAMRIECRGELYQILQVNHLGYSGDFMSLKARTCHRE